MEDSRLVRVPMRVLQESPEPELNALTYLQSIYRNPLEPTSVRMRAAALAIQFESPKLAVTAHVADENIGTRLEQAIERSRHASKLIEAKPIQHASTTTSDLNSNERPNKAPVGSNK
jgi:hypothetical protein